MYIFFIVINHNLATICNAIEEGKDYHYIYIIY